VATVSGGGDVPFQQHPRQQAWSVFIPRQNERGHRQALHVRDQLIERRAFALDAKIRVRRSTCLSRLEEARRLALNGDVVLTDLAMMWGTRQTLSRKV